MNENILLIKGIIISSFYDTNEGRATLKVKPEDGETVSKFYNSVGYKNKRFTPEIVNDSDACISLHTKFNTKLWYSDVEYHEIKPEDLGRIEEGTEIMIALKAVEGKTVYIHSLQYESEYLPYKEFEAFNPFANN